MADVQKKQQPLLPHAVDLFCGAGGLSFGMQQAGINIVAGIDNDPFCKHPFESNVKGRFYQEDIFDLAPEFLASLYPPGHPTVLSGCAPCQPYSTYTNPIGHEQRELQPLDKFSELIAAVQPDIVTMENVSLLTRHEVFSEFLTNLIQSGYHYNYSVVSCSDYGVPQTRRRLVLLASLLGPIDLPSPSNVDQRELTVKKSIHHLEQIAAGCESLTDRLHRASGLSDTNLRRIRSSTPGGTWKDWDEELRAQCHTKTSGRTYSSVYGRMRWDELAPTITTQFHGYGNGRFGHPEQDRAISLREGALLQTFPETYSFLPDDAVIHTAPIARLIGNAVPVKLGTAIGNAILSHVSTNR
ncbi:DNA cytosine methyltransferase [Candidatus Poriferisocius sp.]|uniref:DNA cytosine methyltransferase n=1 Tax=Candidatus Poriferisocius sp. TaxID=3101276 RepID=UPI003B017C07